MIIDLDIKTKILKVSNEQYRGSLRFFKPKLTESIIGSEALKHIQKRIDPKLQTSHTLMLYCYLNDIYEHPQCVCGNLTKFNTTTKEFMTYCSNKCRFENFSETVEARQKSNLEKYGCTNVLASKEIKEKIIQNNLAKYGVENYTQTEKYKESVRGLKRTPDFCENTRKGILKRSYNTIIKTFSHCSPLFTLEEYKGVKGYQKYKWYCKTCGKDFESSCDNGSAPVCEYCAPVGSLHEVVCKKYLESLNVDYKFRYRGLPSGKEIDLFIPDKNFGLELCGLYYHSTAGPSYQKPNHVTKLNECEGNGIKLFTIFDDEMFDLRKRRIVFYKIKNNLGLTKRKIYARQCKIVDVSSKDSERFLNKYHIQGSIGASYRFGLTYKNRLVALMTFNKGRTATGNVSEEGKWELGRYTTIFNFSVVGGGSKLLQHFIKTVNPKHIYSYADRRWSKGNMYEKLGFTFVKDTVPNYWYTKTFKTREHRLNYQKHKLTHFPAYSIDKTEEEIMKEEKYFKTWDCGSKLYVLNLEKSSLID